jgi:hypothetical protein
LIISQEEAFKATKDKYKDWSSFDKNMVIKSFVIDLAPKISPN